MKTETVICDHCSENLTETGPMPKYRLALEPQVVPHRPDKGGGCFIYAVNVLPPLEGRIYHFCGLSCLYLWLERQPLTIIREDK